MKPERIKEMLDMLSDPDAMSGAREEQEAGTELFSTTLKSLDVLNLGRWLYNKEWEDVLVPVRLPKGTSDLLKVMDEAKVEHTVLDRCGECKRRADCLLIQRNPSEILLTHLMKLAFAEMVFRKGSK